MWTTAGKGPVINYGEAEGGGGFKMKKLHI